MFACIHQLIYCARLRLCARFTFSDYHTESERESARERESERESVTETERERQRQRDRDREREREREREGDLLTQIATGKSGEHGLKPLSVIPTRV